MRERVSVYGGELEAGPQARGGFRLRATASGDVNWTRPARPHSPFSSPTSRARRRSCAGCATTTAPVFEDHARLLRGGWEERGGRELDERGRLVFRRVPPAHGRPSTRPSRRSARWPPTMAGRRDLRVRIGIHTGRGTPRRRPATSASPCTAPLGSATPDTAGRCCSRRRRARCSRTRSRTSTLSCRPRRAPAEGLRPPVRIYQLAIAGSRGSSRPCARRRTTRRRTWPSARRSGAERRKSRVVRVLIVDDQALVRAGFRMILEAEPDIEVVGEAADGREAVDEAGASAGRRPDGRPHARDGRDRGDARSCSATATTDEGRDADDVRHGRVRLRGAARRRERVPAQGRAARAARRRRSAPSRAATRCSRPR